VARAIDVMRSSGVEKSGLMTAKLESWTVRAIGKRPPHSDKTYQMGCKQGQAYELGRAADAWWDTTVEFIGSHHALNERRHRQSRNRNAES